MERRLYLHRPGRTEPVRLVGILGSWATGVGPLYRQLGAAIAAAIARGDLRPGDRLPAERDLARALAVSRSTVVAALELLRGDGTLESRQGSGTWIPDRAMPSVDERTRGLQWLARNPLVGVFIGPPGDRIELTAAVPNGTSSALRAAVDAVASDLPSLLEGHGYAPLGLPSLREAIARDYRERGVPTTSDQVLVTSGAQQAIALVAQAFLSPADRVLVEDPTFITALDTFRSHGADIIGVAIGPEGPDPALIRARLRDLRPALTYLVPTNQNPTGATTPDAARRAIAAAAVDASLPLLEDEAVAGLQFDDGPTPRPIAAWAPDGPVLSIGSLSKRAWGGFRLGWLRGPEATIAQIGRLKIMADYGSSTVSQAIGLRILERLPEIEADRRREIRASVDLLGELVERHLPDWTWVRPNGGLTAWLELPAGDAATLAQVALRHGVAIVPGSMMSPSGGYARHIRLTFADAALLPEGIARLAVAWRAYRVAADDAVPERLAWVV